MKIHITAVCISGTNENWNASEIPFYCHTAGYKPSPHYPPAMSRDRLAYLSERRNQANKSALIQYPETEHFLTIDSYYVKQIDQIRQLIKEYTEHDLECILGASNWYLDTARIPARIRYWDGWATPEMVNKRYEYHPRHLGLPEGWEKVRGCGGFAIYPRWVWEKRGYGIPEPFPSAGNEINYLCDCPGISSYVTLNVKALRETPTEVLNRTLTRRIRTTLGLRTRLSSKLRK